MTAVLAASARLHGGGVAPAEEQRRSTADAMEGESLVDLLFEPELVPTVLGMSPTRRRLIKASCTSRFLSTISFLSIDRVVVQVAHRLEYLYDAGEIIIAYANSLQK